MAHASSATSPSGTSLRPELPRSGPGRGRNESDLQIQPLKGWHLPLLSDPAFSSLLPLLQQTLLLGLPDRLLSALAPRQPLVPRVHVALQRQPGHRPAALGLIATRRINRRGSCWHVDHLRLAGTVADDPQAPAPLTILTGLLREAIQQATGAASWIATAATDDRSRLGALREQGFQPQRNERIWHWQGPLGHDGPGDLPAELQLVPLHGRNAALLWHLEQAACPPLLRQLLDRRIEDILDQSRGRGWILLDRNRNEAVAGIRWLEDHPGGGQRVEFSLHPAWQHLLGPATERLLRRAAQGASGLWLAVESGDSVRQHWLQRCGAQCHTEQVLMARSVWRRREEQPARRAVRRLEAVLEQLQPRRRPVPTPLQRHRSPGGWVGP